MKQHTGMRPHDVVILLKIIAKGSQKWFMKDIAYELGISSSEVSESIHRSVIAGLISGDKININKLALLDFLQSGIRYVYPQRPGALVRGMKTAHSASPLDNIIVSEEPYVWAFVEGNTRGQSIEPLHPKIPEACIKDDKFYELIALVDAIRVGRVREQKIAIEILKRKIESA